MVGPVPQQRRKVNLLPLGCPSLSGTGQLTLDKWLTSWVRIDKAASISSKYSFSFPSGSHVTVASLI